jgi:hypothetical protein
MQARGDTYPLLFENHQRRPAELAAMEQRMSGVPPWQCVCRWQKVPMAFSRCRGRDLGGNIAGMEIRPQPVKA